MDASANAVGLWLLGLFGTILIGIVTNAIWDWMKENVTYTSSKWPQLKGGWIIEHQDGSRIGEWANIKQQFGPRFRGELHTPDPSAPGGFLVQEVRGELKDRRRALFTIQQLGHEFEEMGAGMITIDPSHRVATGKSVFFGASAPSEGIAVFTMKRR